MAGWIKIYRELQDHWLAQDMEKLGRWTSLLLMAAHEDKKVLLGSRLIELKRGQIIASNSFLADRWKTSERTVLRFLELLESDGMLHRCTHQKVTILTICNYDSYQDKKRGKCTDVCTDNRTDDAPITHRCRTETKKEKEEKEVFIDVINTPHAYTREQQFAEQYLKEGRWAEAAMMAHLKLEQVQRIFEEFLLEQDHNSYRHRDYPDFKKHFLNYLRVKAEVIRKQIKSETNGNNTGSDKRRGVQVVANQVDDYEGPF